MSLIKQVLKEARALIADERHRTHAEVLEVFDDAIAKAH